MTRSENYLDVAVHLVSSPDDKHWSAELRSVLSMRSGALYPVLWDMLAEGYLDDGWASEPPEVPKGRPRRFYVLTDLGKENLASVVRARKVQIRSTPRFRPAWAP